MKGRVAAVVVGVLVLWTGSTTSARAASDGPSLLVRFAPEATGPDRALALAAIGATVDGTIGALGVTRVHAAADLDADAASAILGKQPGVSEAEPDRAMHLALVANDPLYLRDPYSGLGQWGLRVAGVDRAWDLGMGSPAVVVATVDTGVDPNHPDLAGALLPPVSMLTAASPGCGLSALDDNAHGTHLAGIIAAVANNGFGIAGVASGVKVLSIKALDCTGSGDISDIARGIVYAADRGARIVNLSLGSPDDSFTLRDAVRYAQGKGALVVAAAGNCGQGGGNCDSVNEVWYPAAYPGVIAVGATNPDDTRAPFSTQASYVSLSAPGVRIVSTTPTYGTYLSGKGLTQSYGILSGTSQAAPFVAGVAALTLSQDPTLTAQALADRLRATADDLGLPGADPAFGAGRVNALRAASSPTGVFGAVYDPSGAPRMIAAGASANVLVKLTNTSAFAWGANGPLRLSYHWIDSAGKTAVWDGLRTAVPALLPINGSMTLPTQVRAPNTPGSYKLRFDVVDEGVTWFSGTGVRTGDVAVAVAGPWSATYGTPAVSSVSAGAQQMLPVTVTNTGSVPWPSSGARPVHLSYHWLTPDGHVLVWDGARASLAADLAPGASAMLSLPVSVPAIGGGFVLRLDLVQEGASWFSAQGVAPVDLNLVIAPR
jgi:subtilisin family serine protease